MRTYIICINTVVLGHNLKRETSKVISQISKVFILANIHFFFIIGKDPVTKSVNMKVNMNIRD